jgi:plastocyanin
MRPLLRGACTLAIALVLAACTGGPGITTAPTSPGGTTPGGTTAPSGGGGPAATTAGAAPCTDSTDATDVTASVESSTWMPAAVAAGVDDVITWTNGDSVPHGVELDDDSCGMSTAIQGGQSKSLVFSVAGTFPFHCSIHSSMKGTITIS